MPARNAPGPADGMRFQAAAGVFSQETPSVSQAPPKADVSQLED
jgi:hypothetical protein